MLNKILRNRNIKDWENFSNFSCLQKQVMSLEANHDKLKVFKIIHLRGNNFGRHRKTEKRFKLNRPENLLYKFKKIQ